MLVQLALLCLAAPALAWWPVPEFRPECGCCWPVPEECCEKPTTEPPTTTSETTTFDKPTISETPPNPVPPTAGTTPPCPCEADVVICIDRTGSVEPQELGAVIQFVEDFASSKDPDCFRFAFCVFNNSGAVLSQLGDPIPSAALAAQAAQAPGGQTDTARAFTNTKQIFDEAPDYDPCRVLALFYDGGTDFRDRLEKQVASLNFRYSARVCLMAMDDPEATDTQKANRDEEFECIITKSWHGRIPILLDYSQPLSAADLEDAATALMDCICKDCSDQPDPRAATPAPP